MGLHETRGDSAFLQHDAQTGACLLTVHVTPNAIKCGVDSLYGEPGRQALRIRLQALPVKGRANEALIKWLAKELGVAQRDITLVRGVSGRQKQLLLHADATAVARWERLMPS